MTTAEEYMSRVIEAMENPKPAIPLRDWFAGQALTGCRPDEWVDIKLGAEWCYRIADAMLAARETSHDV